MSRYLATRVAQGILLLFIVSAVVFLIVHSTPGGPAILNNPDVDPESAKPRGGPLDGGGARHV